jgi:hypothetical protein
MKPKQDRSRKAHEDDEVTEAGLESFPASDPPAFNQADPRERRRTASNAGYLKRNTLQRVPARPGNALLQAAVELERPQVPTSLLVVAIVLLTIALLWVALA